MPLFKLPLLLLLAISCFQCGNAVRFAYNNGFTASEIRLCGSAMLDSSAISLTQYTPFSVGRVLFPFKISTKVPNSTLVRSFKTSFTFSITPYKNQLPGPFIFVPSAGIEDAAPAQYLGFLNKTSNDNPNTHVFGVEFDLFRNQEFQDIDDNHVDNYIKVTMAPSKMKKPRTPLLEMEIDLYDLADEMLKHPTCMQADLDSQGSMFMFLELRVLAWPEVYSGFYSVFGNEFLIESGYGGGAGVW
ncbi:L-type lectin-domain containing receptor kinase VII.1-like [Pistacia vera]|uniref:L-type lectin-domain containing receptor kinase VII.1-like n=1 Tax=Pistacia vera TaxID=55513 RepID=UPI0012636E82|nr:L-type lectin-domain containing receptor kinase VII.1-like [Pistacia vera]